MNAQILTDFLTNLLRRPGHIAEKTDVNEDAHFADMVGEAAEAEAEDTASASMPVSSVAAPSSAAAEVSIGSAISMSNAVVFRVMMPAAENNSGPMVATPGRAGDTARPLDGVGVTLADGNGKAPVSASDPQKPSPIATGGLAGDTLVEASEASFLLPQKGAAEAGKEDVSEISETSERYGAASRIEGDRDGGRKGLDASPLAASTSIMQVGASFLFVSDANSRGAPMEPARISGSAAARGLDTMGGGDNQLAGEAKGLGHTDFDVETEGMGAVEIDGSNSHQLQAKNMAELVTTDSNNDEDFAAHRAPGNETRVTTGIVSGTGETAGASRRSADLTAAGLMNARLEFARALQSLEEPVVLRSLPELPPVSTPKSAASVEVAGEGQADSSGGQTSRAPAPEIRAYSVAAVSDTFSPVLAVSMTSGDNSITAQRQDFLAQTSVSETPPSTREALRLLVSDPAESDMQGKSDIHLASDEEEMPRVLMAHRPLSQGNRQDLGDAKTESFDLEMPREKSATAPSSGRETETSPAVQHSAQTTTGSRETVFSTPSGIPASFGEAALLSGNAGSEGGVSAHMSLTGHSVHALQGERQTAATASGVSQQIAQAMSGSGDRPVELTLSPEELGKVRLTLHSHDATITVVVQAERTDTLDLLRRNIDLLARDFREIGYGDVSFSFGEQASGDYKPDPSVRRDSNSEREADPVPRFQTIPVSALSLARDPSGGLDLRM